MPEDLRAPRPRPRPGSSASLTPPALPRPPACTCALTTTVPPIRRAIASASVGRRGDVALEHRNARGLEQRAGLVLVQVHGSLVMVVPVSPRSAAGPVAQARDDRAAAARRARTPPRPRPWASCRPRRARRRAISCSASATVIRRSGRAAGVPQPSNTASTLVRIISTSAPSCARQDRRRRDPCPPPRRRPRGRAADRRRPAAPPPPAAMTMVPCSTSRRTTGSSTIAERQRARRHPPPVRPRRPDPPRGPPRAAAPTSALGQRVADRLGGRGQRRIVPVHQRLGDTRGDVARAPAPRRARSAATAAACSRSSPPSPPPARRAAAARPGGARVSLRTSSSPTCGPLPCTSTMRQPARASSTTGAMLSRAWRNWLVIVAGSPARASALPPSASTAVFTRAPPGKSPRS